MRYILNIRSSSVKNQIERTLCFECNVDDHKKSMSSLRHSHRRRLLFGKSSDGGFRLFKCRLRVQRQSPVEISEKGGIVGRIRPVSLKPLTNESFPLFVAFLLPDIAGFVPKSLQRMGKGSSDTATLLSPTLCVLPRISSINWFEDHGCHSDPPDDLH